MILTAVLRRPLKSLNELLVLWVNAGTARAPNGWKNSGIEFRIMREAGLVKEPPSRDVDGIGETMVKCAEMLIDYPDEVRALYVYAKSGFRVASVKREFGVDTRAAHRMIERGKCLMHAAYIVMKSMSYVNERIR